MKNLNDGGSQYAEPLYNGNIAQTIWKSGDDNVKRGYVYNYDELNRLLEAQFYKSDGIPYTGAYTENLAYDLNGNITSLFRTTGDVNGVSVGMDDLAYSYKDGNGNSNLLLNVSDAVSTGNSMGFVDGNTNPALDDYEYDANGNMVKDRNKGITSISYNYLNLPERIEWSANKFIIYQYNAAGQKVTKTVRNNDSIKVVRYLDGFQYAGDILQFFPHPEGYVKATPTGNITPGSPPTGYAYNYVFNYTDHLGNIRLSYTKDPQQGTLKILEENHYYPFGLKHEVYVTGSKRDFIENSNDPGETILTNVLKTDYQYKYNGKEWQDELGLNFYDYGARNYDPALGRWMNYDPLAEQMRRHSPYNYAFNNPVFFIDPDGMEATDWVHRKINGVLEFHYDRDVKSQADVDAKYGKGNADHVGDGSTLTVKDGEGNVMQKYTFTNDHEENKYGTVTDMDGNTLNSSEIKYGQEFTIFGTCDNCVNAETLHKNYFGTSYTGPNNPTNYNGKDSYQYMPRNISEYGSMFHDKGYDAKGATGVTGALFDTNVKYDDARLAIFNTINAVRPFVPLKDRLRSVVTAAAFTWIYLFKQEMSR